MTAGQIVMWVLLTPVILVVAFAAVHEVRACIRESRENR